ncbi:MAG: YDG domain-containing protein [Arcicella sp.]|nr:YDG domain-containing protein [Arcicella sp.]
MKTFFTTRQFNFSKASQKNFCFSLFMFVLLLGQVGFAQTKTWTGAVDGNWNTAGNWNPSGVPTNADDAIIDFDANISISSAATCKSLQVTNDSDVLLSSSGAARALTIDGSGSTIGSGSSLTLLGTGGVLTVEYLGSGRTMNIAGTMTMGNSTTYNPVNSVTTVNGSLIRTGSSTTIGTSTTSTLIFGSTGIYEHGVNGVDIPVADWDDNSLLKITGVTTSNITGSNQSFGNVEWNCTSQTATVNFGTATTAIDGNFKIINTGSNGIGMNNGDSPGLIIGGDYEQTGGTLRLATSVARTFTVNGKFSLTGGTLTLSNGTGIGTLNVKGYFTHTGGTITQTGAGSGKINFDGTTTYTSGGTVSNTINFEVNTNKTLTMAAAGTTITGAGAFVLNSGATLNIKSADGITSSGATGNIQVAGSRTYNTGANYIYSGAATQVTGNGLPASVNNLTINNSAGVTLTSNATVNGALALTSGLLTTSPSAAPTIASAGLISGASSSSYVSGPLKREYSATGSKTFPIGKGGNYRAISLDYTALSGGTSTVTAEQMESTIGGTLPTGVSVQSGRHWDISESGSTSRTYSLTLDGDPFTAATPIIVKGDGSTNTKTTATVAGTNFTATGFMTFSKFAVGNCTNPTITTQPDNSSITYGDNTTFTISASGVDSYAWEEFDGSSWTAISDGGIYSGATTGTLTLTKAPFAKNGFKYRCVLTNACGSTTSDGAATLAVGKKALTVTAVASTKTYDGTTASAGMPTVGALVGTDMVDVAPIQTYDNKTQGAGKTLTPSGLTIKNGATDVTGNYDITYTAVNTGVIEKATVIVTAVASTKTYDGTTASAGVPTVGALVGTDMVDVAPIQTYDNKTQGTGKTLTPSGLTIKNGATDVTGNYDITYTAVNTGVIEKATVIVTAVASTKTYDGTTASAGVPTVGALVGTDMVDVAPIQTYDNKTQGTGKTLTPSGLTIKNGATDVTGNYDITYTAVNTGVIEKATVIVTAVASTKTYDGTTASAGVPTVGALVGTDMVDVAPIQTYDNKTQGTGKTLTPSGLTIKNGATDVTGNYDITYTAVNTGVIEKATVIVTAVASTKTYDGTTASAGVPTVGALVSGDMVDVAPIQTYDNKTQGAGKTLTPSGLTIKNGATDVTGNYDITYTAVNTGVIEKATVIVTAVASTKTYDGTTASAGVPTVGALVSGDMVDVAPIQTYDNKTQGTGKTLTPSGLTIKNGATDVTGNYDITYTAVNTGVIEKATVIVTAVASTKTYDGTTASAGVPTVGALVGTRYGRCCSNSDL